MLVVSLTRLKLLADMTKKKTEYVSFKLIAKGCMSVCFFDYHGYSKISLESVVTYEGNIEETCKIGYTIKAEYFYIFLTACDGAQIKIDIDVDKNQLLFTNDIFTLRTDILDILTIIG